VAIDVSRESYDEVGAPVIDKAGVAHKVDFRVGLAMPVLDELVAEVQYTTPSPPTDITITARNLLVLFLLCRRGTRGGSTSRSWTRTR
jgi:hypothetical protein